MQSWKQAGECEGTQGLGREKLILVVGLVLEHCMPGNATENFIKH